ncbi:glycosyltransferase [bacterium]|nr:glycosyltransferase [bacterium]
MNNGLDIAFFGSSLVSTYWNRATRYFRGVIRALHEHGHRVRFYEPVAFERQKNRDIDDPEYARSIIYPATLNSVRKVLTQARGVDVVIKVSAVGVFDVFLEEELLEFQQDGTKVLFWDVDPPATLHSIHNSPHDLFKALIPEYDAILTYGGGPAINDAYLELGAQRAETIYHALDPTRYRPVLPDDRFQCQLAYNGDLNKTVRDSVQEFFFGPAKAIDHKRFVLGGHGWEQECPPLPNVHYHGPVADTDLNAFFGTPSATLCLCRPELHNGGYFPTPHLFIIAGCGGCIVTQPSPGIEQFLTPGSECITASNGQELANKLATLSRDDSAAIGDAARARMLNEHTWTHRATQLETLIA